MKTPGESESSIEQADIEFGGFASKQDYINYAINMGMKGDMDYVNAIPEKPFEEWPKQEWLNPKELVSFHYRKRLR